MEQPTTLTRRLIHPRPLALLAVRAGLMRRVRPSIPDLRRSVPALYDKFAALYDISATLYNNSAHQYDRSAALYDVAVEH